MHEMSIAEQLIESVIETATANDAIKIEDVELEIGEMRLIVPSALELAFEVVSEGTIAQGATLTMTEKKIKMECGNCSNRYGAEIGNFICPKCSKAEGKIIEGNEILIMAITCDVESEGDKI